MLLKGAALLPELPSTGSDGRVFSRTSSSDSARHRAGVRVTLPTPAPPSPWRLFQRPHRRFSAFTNARTRGRDAEWARWWCRAGKLRVSHLVEEFITSLVYFPHKYTIQGGLRLLGHRRHANWVCAGNGSGSGPPSSGSEGPADSAAGRMQWKAELRGRAEERQHHSELRRTCLTRCSRAHRHERNPGGNSLRNHLHKNPQTCP